MSNNTIAKKLIAEVIDKEKGYVNHREDKGGPTKYGITKDTLSAWLKRPATIDDVKNLTLSMASDIYENEYFIKPKIDKLPADILPIVFDMAVNHGISGSVKMLQKELAEFGSGFSVSDADGAIGKRTIEAAKKVCDMNAKLFVNELVDRRINFYRDIVKNRPSQKVFLNGWLSRAESFRVK